MSRTNLLDLLRKHVSDADVLGELTREITDLQRSLQKTTLHLQLLEKAVESDYDSILITEISLDQPGPRIVYVNDGFTRLTGYTRDEAIGKTPRILQGPKTDKAVLSVLKNRLSQGKSFFGNTVNYRKDGSEFINQWDIHPLFNEKGELAWWVSYQHDITERKRSEIGYMDAQQEFGDLYEESKRITLDVDLQGNVVSAGKLFRDLGGFDVEALKKVRVWDLFDAGSRERIREEMLKETPFEAGAMEVDLVAAKGATVAVSLQARKITAPDQTLVRIHVENRSAQNRILETLRARGGSMGSLFDASGASGGRSVAGASGGGGGGGNGGSGGGGNGGAS